MKGIEQQIIEVHRIVFLELLLICAVYIIDYLILKFSAVNLKIGFRVDVGFFLFAYHSGKICLRKKLCIDILLFHYVLNQRFLVYRVIYHKILVVSDRLCVFSQNPKTHRMKCQNPHTRAVSDQFLNALSHLACRLVGKRHCQYSVWAYSVFNQICNSVRHRCCLTASCPRQNKQRPVQMSYRFLLLRI